MTACSKCGRRTKIPEVVTAPHSAAELVIVLIRGRRRRDTLRDRPCVGPPASTQRPGSGTDGSSRLDSPALDERRDAALKLGERVCEESSVQAGRPEASL